MVKARSLENVPVFRYFCFRNVLHIWNIRAIPTYRVYRLYDYNNIYPGEKFGEKNARCALIGGDSRDPSDSRQFLADYAI